MSSEKEKGPAIIEAHQEMVRHIEQGALRMRALSIITIVVGVLLALGYVYQLALGLTGTSTVTVNLADPVNIATEVAVLVIVLLWLYVGVNDLRFATKMKGEIALARIKEKGIEQKVV